MYRQLAKQSSILIFFLVMSFTQSAFQQYTPQAPQATTYQSTLQIPMPAGPQINVSVAKTSASMKPNSFPQLFDQSEISQADKESCDSSDLNRLENLSLGSHSKPRLEPLLNTDQKKTSPAKGALGITHSSSRMGIRTKAGQLGYSTGRWTKLEHYLFVEGKQISSPFRTLNLRQELEESRERFTHKDRNLDSISRSKILLACVERVWSFKRSQICHREHVQCLGNQKTQ